MSHFKLNYEGIDFTIELERDSQFKPDSKWVQKEDFDEDLHYFKMTINCSINNLTSTHLYFGLQLPLDEDQQLSDLELILEDDNILDELVEFWKKSENTNKLPSWAKL